jgi:hypothetical protein
MPRRGRLYQSLYGLSRNPFPEQAIATASDGALPFYEGLHPGIGVEMARAFIGGDDNMVPRVGFLWALGEREDARGFGKTRHLLWFADRVNYDLGQSIAKLLGPKSKAPRIFALYSSFNPSMGSRSVIYFSTPFAMRLERARASWVRCERQRSRKDVLAKCSIEPLRSL